MPASPSALRLPAEVRARARAKKRPDGPLRPPPPPASRRRLRVVERARRTSFPIEAVEVD